MTATVHRLPLKLGRCLRAEVVETADRVYVHIAGDQARRSEEEAVKAFLLPIFQRFENDKRPIELDSSRNEGPAAVLHTLGWSGDEVFLGVEQLERPRLRA